MPEEEALEFAGGSHIVEEAGEEAVELRGFVGAYGELRSVKAVFAGVEVDRHHASE